MRTLLFTAAALCLAVPANASGQRSLDAHEHGVGALNIAFEGDHIALEFEAPGADIVGFEHPAESAADREAIHEAIEALEKPLSLFVIPAAAKCSVDKVEAHLVGEEDEHHGDHKDHDHGEKKAGKHDHDHDHGTKKAAKDDHDHNHGHDEHKGEESHTEFHAEYLLHCANPKAVNKIEFVYFKRFPNARELEVQLISDKGTHRFEVERDEPVLSLDGSI